MKWIPPLRTTKGVRVKDMRREWRVWGGHTDWILAFLCLEFLGWSVGIYFSSYLDSWFNFTESLIFAFTNAELQIIAIDFLLVREFIARKAFQVKYLSTVHQTTFHISVLKGCNLEDILISQATGGRYSNYNNQDLNQESLWFSLCNRKILINKRRSPWCQAWENCHRGCKLKADPL